MKNSLCLSEAEITSSVEALKLILSNTYLLYTRTLYCHWNVEGPHFYTLHKMFQEQYEELADASDLLAERIRSLGSITPGTMTDFLNISSMKEEWPKDEKEMIKSLTRGHEEIIKTLHDSLKKITESKDEGTRDVMIERLRAHEKTLWMLRSLKS